MDRKSASVRLYKLCLDGDFHSGNELSLTAGRRFSARIYDLKQRGVEFITRRPTKENGNYYWKMIQFPEDLINDTGERLRDRKLSKEEQKALDIDEKVENLRFDESSEMISFRCPVYPLLNKILLFSIGFVSSAFVLLLIDNFL